MPRRLAPFLYPLILFLCLLVVWWPVFGYEFIWDDEIYILNTPYFRHLDFFYQLISSPFFVSPNYYRPIPVGLLALTGSAFGDNPAPFHALVFFIHCGNCFVLYFICQHLLSKRQSEHSYLLAFCVAVLFGAHPSVTEIVAWISGIFDNLFAFFAGLLLLIELRCKSLGLRFIGVFFAFLAAALTKEMAATFVILLPVWHIFCSWVERKKLLVWLQDNKVRLLEVYAACFFAGVTYLVLRYFALGTLYDASASPDVYGAYQNTLLLFVKTLGFYVTHIVYPFWDISPVYSIELFNVFHLPSDLIYYAVGVITCVCIFLASRTKVKKGLLSCCFMVLAALFPVLNLLPLSIGDNFAHLRFVYFPTLIFFVGLSIWINEINGLPKVRNYARYVGVIWLGAAILTCKSTLTFWQNELFFWGWAKEVRKQSYVATANFYWALRKRGRCDLVVRDLESYKVEVSSLKTRSTLLAFCYAETDEFEKAEFHFEQLISTSYVTGEATPDFNLSKIYSNLAKLYLDNKPDMQGIGDIIKWALQLDPNNYSALYQHGRYLHLQGDVDGAKRLFSRSLELMPSRQAERLRKATFEKYNVDIK